MQCAERAYSTALHQLGNSSVCVVVLNALHKGFRLCNAVLTALAESYHIVDADRAVHHTAKLRR